MDELILWNGKNAVVNEAKALYLIETNGDYPTEVHAILTKGGQLLYIKKDSSDMYRPQFGFYEKPSEVKSINSHEATDILTAFMERTYNTVWLVTCTGEVLMKWYPAQYHDDRQNLRFLLRKAFDVRCITDGECGKWHIENHCVYYHEDGNYLNSGISAVEINGFLSQIEKTPDEKFSEKLLKDVRETMAERASDYYKERKYIRI